MKTKKTGNIKAYLWNGNSIITIAPNKERAKENIIERLKHHPKLISIVSQTEPIVVNENETRIFFTKP